MKRKALPPDKKEARPLNIKNARLLIEKTFREQGKLGWDLRDRQIYFSMLKVAGTDNADDVRVVLADLEKSKLILFAD